ncbi:aldehyde dehydrogenase family protein [Winogradskyella aurantiaca]|uniref:aldehyde dehydrogenase family protein n=1 Tax=Winogradskyella aurantiaca TaxID=2219558 RepID=UPI000E1C9E5C|nr:aldehyde dehydrogenase family protein [Winogradskyella aurantiaca]
MDKQFLECFKKQKQHQEKVGQISYNQRIRMLNALHRAVEHTYRKDIIEALATDLGKPKVEAELTEIFQIIGTIKHAKSNLHKWMRPKKVATPLAMLGASSSYIHEPKGVCLIISPWNFPFNLTFGPLASAITAGNSVIIKPSEVTPRSSEVMGDIVKTIFKEEEVSLFQGAVETSTALLELPFNHIFFTGSPAIGKIVMTAAAKHLASVTLELGGKSPTIIDSTANLDAAAKKLMWAKSLNCGQICVAPDYILVEEGIKDKFLKSCKKWLVTFFGEDSKSSESYGRIVSDKHYKRLEQHIENAVSSGGKLIAGGQVDAASRFIAPTLIDNVDPEASVLKDEIFGPILPIVTYRSLDDAISYINTKERPLALYIYSRSKANIKTIIKNTKAGGTVVNNSNIQFGNHELPFGGINNSGVGKSHGFFGFEAFSNKRALMKQHTFGVTEMLFPPYTGFTEALTKFAVKWF